MKKILLRLTILITFIISTRQIQAQYVNIPDSNFRAFLYTQFPSAIAGNQLDTSNINVVNTTAIHCDSLHIKNLDGLQYFNNLQVFSCVNNQLHSLPALPPTLSYLDCSMNELDSLPPLPASLVTLNCSRNFLHSLASLPSTLTTLYCFENHLNSLPALNTNLTTLNCSQNYIDSLPTLNASLLMFDCSSNQLTQLPALPSNLQVLISSGNNLNALPSLPSSLTKLVCNTNHITSLPMLPSALNYLDCSFNLLTALPSLPNSLTNLSCSVNQLTVLPTLNGNLITLECNSNQISSLPSLPATLSVLRCNNNLLTTLPPLPAGLGILDCAANQIPSISSLPASLYNFDYSSNPITTLPVLPVSLKLLYWNGNPNPLLPNLSSQLVELHASFNVFDSLPVLPPTLTILECIQDSLSFLPPLPSALDQLTISYNKFSTMPSLPPALTHLDVDHNHITSFTYLPSSVRSLNCSNNPFLACLPKLASVMNYIQLDGTSIGCLPNFFSIIDTPKTSFAAFTLPLCTPASGCTCAWNITGNVHAYNGGSCYLDSLSPGPRAAGLMVDLYKNSNFVELAMLSHDGQYSFDTNDTDTLDVMIDTTDMPFKISCPTSFSHHLIQTPADSMKTNINFAVECNGIDAAVNAIMGRFRAGDISHVLIQAGSSSQFYNINCPLVYAATVTTVIDGPVQYVGPSATALTPNSVAGNVLTYMIPDMSLVDANKAFCIDLMTDTSAPLGATICITTTISNVAGDIRPANNDKQMCFNVVGSFDPNAKTVSPADHSNPGDLLTYTIFFQNTGNDTARRIVVRDTLSTHLDPSSFKLIASSHDVEVSLQNNILIFYFNNINLPDSLHHEPFSHGWVQFSIRLKTNIALGTATKNIASIYFDYNSPVQTGTAINYVVPDPTFEAPTNPILVPNAITPNRDGLNDRWHCLNKSFLDQKELTVECVIITNRWGQKVYQGYGNSFEWDGYGVGSSDVFTYQIVYRTRSGNEHVQRGEIILIL